MLLLALQMRVLLRWKFGSPGGSSAAVQMVIVSALILVEQQVGDPFVDGEFAASLRAHQGALQQLYLQRQHQ